VSVILSTALALSVVVMVGCVAASVRAHRALLRRLRVRRGPVLVGVGRALRHSLERGEILN